MDDVRGDSLQVFKNFSFFTTLHFWRTPKKMISVTHLRFAEQTPLVVCFAVELDNQPTNHRSLITSVLWKFSLENV